jgi:formiminotetrahydrofolate cyclodeaminase
MTGESVIEWSLMELLRRLADARDPSGSGLLAAVTLASASASARMVVSLESKRSTHDQSAACALARAAESLERLTSDFLQQADQDRAALARLLAALRARQRSSGQDAVDSLPEAASAAARVPVATAEAGLELLRQITAVAPHCSPFVASDLAAAAELARAAIAAATWMVQANLPLLDEPLATQLGARANALIEQAQACLVELSMSWPSTRPNEE